jgi:hypothetical protein
VQNEVQNMQLTYLSSINSSTYLFSPQPYTWSI